jgi:hypothetical protein
LRGEGRGEGEKEVRRSFPLTSVLSLGGERKIKVKGFHRRLLRHFVPRNDETNEINEPTK